MLKLSYLLFLTFFCNTVVAQNLVPNPSFEDTLPHNNCINGIETANHWFNPNAATPDLYSYKPSCSYSSFNNPSGHQNPKTGLCYAGIYGYLSPTREYIAVELDSNLSNGCSYFLEFNISRADKFGLACDKLGLTFTNDTTGYKGLSTALPLTPAIQSNPGLLLIDSANWQSINGYYTANGTERFLIIGNFYDDINTIWDTIDASAPALNGAYYYVDDVKILPCGISGIGLNNAASNLFIQQIGKNEIKITGSFDEPFVELVQIDLFGREILKQKLRWQRGIDIVVKINISCTSISLISLITNNSLITKKIMQ